MYDLTQKKILAVDDEPDNLFVFKATVEMMHGAVVQTTANCDEALTVLQTFAPEIIVTDLSMPKKDGYFLLHELRKRPDTARLPIIALTAHAMSGDKERILAAGFDGYIAKPFEISTLGPDLAELVEKHALRQAQPPEVPLELPLPNEPDQTDIVNGGNYAAR